MPFSIQENEAVPSAVRRIATEQIEAVLAALNGVDLTDSEKAYVLRRRCKKLRALLRLVRDGFADDQVYMEENARLRGISQRFSDLRDADMLVGAYDGLMDKRARPLNEDRRRFGPIRRRLTHDQKHNLSAIGPTLPLMLKEACDEVGAIRDHTRGWEFNSDGCFALLEGGLRRIYRRAQQTRNQARTRPTIERLHQWRKQAKYHRNHLRILKRIEPATMALRIDLANTLNQALGDDHDLALLRSKITDEAYFKRIRSTGEFVDLIDQRRRELQIQAFQCGKFLFDERSGRMVQALRDLWEDWQTRNSAADPATSFPPGR